MQSVGSWCTCSLLTVSKIYRSRSSWWVLQVLIQTSGLFRISYWLYIMLGGMMTVTNQLWVWADLRQKSLTTNDFWFARADKDRALFNLPERSHETVVSVQNSHRFGVLQKTTCNIQVSSAAETSLKQARELCVRIAHLYDFLLCRSRRILLLPYSSFTQSLKRQRPKACSKDWACNSGAPLVKRYCVNISIVSCVLKWIQHMWSTLRVWVPNVNMLRRRASSTTCRLRFECEFMPSKVCLLMWERQQCLSSSGSYALPKIEGEQDASGHICLCILTSNADAVVAVARVPWT